jgi:hypothetical protein
VKDSERKTMRESDILSWEVSNKRIFYEQLTSNSATTKIENKIILDKFELLFYFDF